MEDSYYWDLISKHLAGKTSETENRQLEIWVNEAEENKRSFELQRKLWENTAGQSLDFDTEKRWERLLSEIAKERPAKSFSINSVLKIAASVLLLLGITFLIKHFVFERPEMISVRSSYSQKLKVVLPDNSVVWLNAGSQMKYPEQFSEKVRNVELEGEAFFEVTKNPSKPFVIEAQETQTKVLGTSFNVRALQDDKSVVVTVATGRVSFHSTESDNHELILLAGDRGLFDKKIKSLQKEKNENENFLTWKSGILKFENASVKEVINVLEDYYKKEISFENLHLANCKITTTFENRPLEKVLSELEILLDIEVEKRESSIILRGRGCK